MSSNNETENKETIDPKRNDNAGTGDDTIGENTGDSALDEAAEKENGHSAGSSVEEEKQKEIETVTPENDNGEAGPGKK